jgi:hypothetical protein
LWNDSCIGNGVVAKCQQEIVKNKTETKKSGRFKNFYFEKLIKNNEN